MQADATERLPFADGEFDLAYCSSVVEHVAAGAARGVRGRDPARRRAAGSCRRRRCSFPIEPHALLPVRPLAAGRRCGGRYWRLGAAGAWEDIALLRRAEMDALFGEPVHAERLGGAGQELDRVAGDRSPERLIHSPHDCE